MAQPSWLGLFKKAVGDFAEDLVEWYGAQRPELKVYAAEIDLFMRANPRMGAQKFYTHLTPKETMILARDERLWEFDPTDTRHPDKFAKLLSMREVWDGSSEMHKERVWKHFTLLLALSQLAVTGKTNIKL